MNVFIDMNNGFVPFSICAWVRFCCIFMILDGNGVRLLNIFILYCTSISILILLLFTVVVVVFLLFIFFFYIESLFE